MKPKFACADYTFPLLTHDQTLDLIAMLGFEAVDVGLFENRSHLRPGGEFQNVEGNARKLGKRLSDRGLKPADIFLIPDPDFHALSPNHPDEKIRQKSREAFLQSLEYTVACGGRHASGLPGAHFDSESKSDSFARCCEELDWRCRKAQEYDVVYSVEAHLGSIVPVPSEAAQLLEQVPDLTLTLDYGHFILQGFQDADVEPLMARASHFHARGGNRNRLQASVKENTIDYRRVASLMEEVNYRGFICLEYVWIDWEGCNEVDNISETILLRELLEKEFARSQIGF